MHLCYEVGDDMDYLLGLWISERKPDLECCVHLARPWL